MKLVELGLRSMVIINDQKRGTVKLAVGIA